MTLTPKQRAGEAAAKFVTDGMTLGIGTGSTANAFIDAVGEQCKAGFHIAGVPTSRASEERARGVGIEIITPDETTKIDLAIDGADEIDRGLNLIKGGGGALFREKIIAASAVQFIVIADNAKKVHTLGAFDLPIEIEPFGFGLTLQLLRELLADNGFDNPKLTLRAGIDGAFLSDGAHYIVDCALARIEEPKALDRALRDIPGVIETGLFCDMTDIALIADETRVEELRP